jgi:ribosome-associated protein
MSRARADEAFRIDTAPEMKTSTRQQVATAVAACEDKKAEDIVVLQMDRSSSAFTDYFVICTGTNARQIQAIADDVELRLKQQGQIPNNVEGYNRAEWVLIDYVDFVVHVFSENARGHYNLERLWKSAKKLTAADLRKPEVREERPRAVAVKRASGKKTATKRASRATSTRTAAKKSSRRRAAAARGRASSRTTSTRKKK